MGVVSATLTSLPFTQFRRHPRFYLYYDGFYLVTLSLVLVGLLASGFSGLVTGWHAWYWALLPLACHAQILCSVFIHNATHNNFPRTINRLVGEALGLVVLSRFASWEVIHQRHHRYSDDRDKDPHPVLPSYWRYVLRTVVSVEEQLQRIYLETHGDTPENRRYERKRAYVSYATNVVLIAVWYFLLGPVGFLFFFVPSALVGFFHLIHFNWSTHNGFDPDGDYMPVNLDRGFYWVGNRLWFGIYMHANHHKKANLFNPALMPAGPAVAALEEAA